MLCLGPLFLCFLLLFVFLVAFPFLGEVGCVLLVYNSFYSSGVLLLCFIMVFGLVGGWGEGGVSLD